MSLCIIYSTITVSNANSNKYTVTRKIVHLPWPSSSPWWIWIHKISSIFTWQDEICHVFWQPLHLCVCVCVRARARASACVRACVCVCICLRIIKNLSARQRCEFWRYLNSFFVTIKHIGSKEMISFWGKSVKKKHPCYQVSRYFL